MCGRYALYSSAEDLTEIFRIVGTLDCQPRYNVAPTQDLPVILAGHTLAWMRWGLVPAWSKDGKPWINARREGLFDKPAFRGPARHRRCLVPADGFYEWRKVGKGKEPLFIRRRDGRPFAMAGIWEPGHRGGPATYAVVTTEPNALVAPIHDRMPAILVGDAAERWLDEDADPAALAGLLDPPDAGLFQAVPVAPRVNDVHNEGPDLVAALPPQQPALFPR